MKNGKLAILVPSRGRPKTFGRLVDSIHATGLDKYDIILRNGEADPVKDEYAVFEGEHSLIRVVGPDDGFPWPNAGYNLAQQDLWLRFPDYSAYLMIEDDCVMHTPGFDVDLLAMFDMFPGRVGLLELHDRAGTIRVLCVSAEWCDALGFLYPREVGEHGFEQLPQLAMRAPAQYAKAVGIQYTHYPLLRHYGYTGDERPGALAQPEVVAAFHAQAAAAEEWNKVHGRESKRALVTKAGVEWPSYL